MKLTCLSSNPSKPCFVLYFKGVSLMLDCGLDIGQIQHFLPLTVIPGCQISKVRTWNPGVDRKSKLGEDVCQELKECGGRVFVDGTPQFLTPEVNMVDLTQIDAILISNYSCMLALPYITEYTGFRGVVYCTEPTLQIGRQYMEELLTYVERNPRAHIATRWKQQEILKNLPAPLKEAVKPSVWKQCYTLQDVESSLSRVQIVGFNQKTDIFGSMKVMPSSSGYSLGSCNWVIKSAHEKVCYVSGSSTLTTHPKPMEQAPLRNSDILILSCLTQTPLANPDPMIGEFCVNAAVTIKNGGNVLVPCYPSGVTYDLFECLSGHMDQCGLAHVPLYFLSPVSDSTLAYSNIFAEWLSQSKQSKVYLPEPPFPHAELVSLGRLKNFKSVHDGLGTDFKTPCVMFAGHPSLRLGDAVHFIELWGKSASNTVIFTEPDFPYLEALGPFQPLAMRVCYCPIDTSLSFAQANKLIKDLRPLHLVVAETYTSPPLLAPQRTDLTISWEPAPLTYKRGEILSLPIKRQYESIQLHPELAETLEPMEVKPGTAVSMVTGFLEVRDNNYILKPMQKEAVPGDKRKLDGSKSKSYLFGSPNIQSFVDDLGKAGVSCIKVEETGSGTIIHLPNDDTLIQLESDSTHIICEGDESIRVRLRDTLLKCLQRL
ncbi:integrator complex subunit 9-like isoform X1 [Haliotis rufescens]|uniref:integrator complex subunit 9-like isoform X1 n=1 Tax=Haliotis rufescens TaxID=6454 RepID=UPI001EAFEED7|nr:integrator complex subunit 9-like isoform X1 [Haliotis rufescens]XP_048237857.1 integrator complex subunit 9-like isoform X1 [Haliotis rufescens]